MSGAISQHSFSIANLSRQELASVRAAADNGNSKMGLFERICDCISDWVFNTDRAECKQCLLTFSHQDSTHVERLEAFRRLESLAGSGYKDRFSVDFSNAEFIKLSIDVGLPECEHFCSGTSKNCFVGEHLSKWGPSLDWKTLASQLDSLDAPETTIEEKYAFFDNLRSAVDDDYLEAFKEEFVFEGKKYVFSIDIELEPLNDFIYYEDTYKRIDIKSCENFENGILSIAESPLLPGSQKQFEKDINRDLFTINGVEFKPSKSELEDPSKSVARISKELAAEGLTETEIAMVKKFCHQTTSREFKRLALDGYDIQFPQSGRPTEYIITKVNGVFSIELTASHAPLMTKTLDEASDMVGAYREFAPLNSIAEKEKKANTEDPSYKGWKNIESDRKITWSEDTQYKIRLEFLNPESRPKIEIEANFLQFAHPR
ncbi:hypothetical protein [Ottowia thiooxydans]|uniref:Uncharacterized protein n=1 Tax=Ottowia thiooxydans TaxID=219182 RepID=A0ABV2QF77_9BURK